MGETISHYRLEERLGVGGHGVVYRAVDERLGRNVAIKLLSPELARKREMRERFVTEARAASSLDHPNICTIFEIDETSDEQLFIVMAYYDGEPLDDILERGPLGPSRALGIAIQIAKGLAAAHEELIVHRDVKPGNVIVCAEDLIKIVDFGLAKLGGRIRLTDPGSALGTPAYMSPEQIRGEPVDARSDIWSLGVVLFEMITGTLPFRGDRIESVIHSILNDAPRSVGSTHPHLPGGFDAIVRRALEKSPRARYARIEEMITDLQSLAADNDPSAPTLRRPVERARRSIAILPFVDMSPGGGQEYLADGIAEELMGALSQIPDLWVASRTSSFQFRGKAVDVREVGQRLNVDTIVEGSVRKVEHRLRVAVQLVDVEDGYRLWSERYDRDTEDLLAIQDEIARSIARALEVTLATQGGRHRGLAAIDPEAWKLYLQGRQFCHQHRRKSFEIARHTFERAIEIAPDFALAWAGLANCSSFTRLYFGGGDDTSRDAETASLRALALAPDLAETRVARGLALSLDGKYDEAGVELEKAVALDPGSYEAHYFYGRVEFARGRMEQAETHFRRAAEIDPAAQDTWYLLGMTLRKRGKLALAKTANVECVEAAKRRVDAHPEDTRAWTMGAAVFADLGEPDTAARWLARAIEVDPDEPLIQYNAACVYVALGRFDDAFRSLEMALQMGVLLDWVKNDPDLDPIRDDARYEALFGHAAVSE